MRLALSLLFALASLPPAAHPASALAQSSGATYYVSQAANAADSNPGTASAPLRTINAAVARAAAGDTINVADGTYAEAVPLLPATVAPQVSRSRCAQYVSYDLNVTNGGAFYLWLLSTGPDSAPTASGYRSTSASTRR